ncbi:GTP-binding protein 1 [Fasciola gigantica]|uniref:GTP-binding protein 1 n=1 Tax=Fasciola gigantica TaxID=46835 RepID=A0A504Y6Z8_FASGI|nr:GTP-binding protein 1 [Fasciola gigantica]
MLQDDGAVAVNSSDKFAFVNPDDVQFGQLESLLNKRLDDGQGECFLELGVGEGQTPGLSPTELQQSVITTERLAQRLHVSLIHLRDRVGSGPNSRTTVPLPPASSPGSPHPNGSCKSPPVSSPAATATDSLQLSPTFPNSDLTSPSVGKNKKGKRRERPKPTEQIESVAQDQPIMNYVNGLTSVAASVPVVREYLLRRETAADDFVDIRVAVVGNVDAGKSTLLGVLTHGELDNGRGQARLRLLRHKHEAESGRTSSVSNDILGFNAAGQVVNKPVHGHLDWTTICKASSKVVTFIDLAGHERYLKTTIFGMTGHAPDYAMFMVGANSGVIGMAKEHLGLALALGVPVFVVVTKIDMCPPNVLQETMNLLVRILKSPGCRKIPILISTNLLISFPHTHRDDVICSATNFTSERMCPIFSLSNVTGENMDLLKLFLNLLTPRAQPRLDEPAHFQVDDIFSVPGVGNVVSGTCLCGIIRLNDNLLLGPDPMGQFTSVPIKSIHRKRMPVSYVRGGQTASFALKKLRRNQLRKGIVLVAPELQPRACLEFTAEVLILHHPTTISVGYQAMVHAGPVRQTATILSLSVCERLRTGDKDLVRFRFIKYPEYLYPGLRLIFREGKTKAVGTVKETYPIAEAIQPVSRTRLFRKFNYQGTAGARSGTTDTNTSDSRSSTAVTVTDLSDALAANTVPALDPHRPAYSKQRKHYRRGNKDQVHKVSTAASTAPPASSAAPTGVIAAAPVSIESVVPGKMCL